MYKVLCDNALMCDSRMEGLALINPIIRLKENQAGSFTFKILPGHPFYDSIQKRKTIIKVYQDEEMLFSGICIEASTDFYKQKEIYCEGELAYFNDSIQRPARYKNQTVRSVLETLVESHNSQVEEAKHFVVGEVTVEGEDITCYTNMEKTIECLQKCLVDKLGGIVRIRYADGVKYVDYLAESPHTNSQMIKLGENLLDFTSNIDSSDIATAVIPLGVTLAFNEILGLDTRLTIKTVNNDVDYVYNQEAVDAYGWIFKTLEFDDISKASTLKTKGEEYLKTSQFENVVIQAKAVDLHLIDKSIERIKLSDEIRVVSPKHGMDKTFRVTQQILNLNNPEKDTITLGKDEQMALSARSNHTDYFVKKVGESSVQSVMVEYALGDDSTAAPTSGWSIESPVWQEGKYMWQRTATMTGSGIITYSEAVCIQGAKGQDGADGKDGKDGVNGEKGEKGDTGATGAAGADGKDGANGKDGVGVKSVVEQYYLSTSSTTQTGGSWSTACPTWKSGYYIWQRQVVTKTDNTTTTTTPVLANALNSANSTANTANTIATSASSTANYANTKATEAKDAVGDLESNVYVPDTTEINGGNIATGTIDAACIKANSIFSQKISATNLAITGDSTFQGTITGSTISSVSPDGTEVVVSDGFINTYDGDGNSLTKYGNNTMKFYSTSNPEELVGTITTMQSWYGTENDSLSLSSGLTTVEVSDNGICVGNNGTALFATDEERYIDMYADTTIHENLYVSRTLHVGGLIFTASGADLDSVANEVKEHVFNDYGSPTVIYKRYTSNAPFVCPCDGILLLGVGWGASAYVRAAVRNASGTFSRQMAVSNTTSGSTSSNDASLPVFKGMEIYDFGSTAVANGGEYINFYPFVKS